MSLTDLQAALQAQADGNHNVVTVTSALVGGASLTPREGFDQTLDSALRVQGGLPVTVSGPIPAPAGDTLTFGGQSSLLGLAGAAVTLVFVQQPGAGAPVDLRVSVSLGDKWKFSRSFPTVQGYPFDDLTLDDAYYAFTTAPLDTYEWGGQSVATTQGLNFVSSLVMGGPLVVLEAILESFSKTDAVMLAGTIDPSGLDAQGLGVPAISLVGSVAGGVNAIPNYLPLSDPRVSLQTVKGDDGTDRYLLSFLVTLSIEGTAYGDLKTTLLPNSTTFSFWFVPSRPITAETIIKLMGGADFTRLIPSELSSIFEAVGLQGLGVSVDIKSINVTSFSAAIGSTGPWDMGQFTIEQVTLRYTVLNPFGSATELFFFDAVSTIFPDIFDGQFEVEISYDLTSKALGVAAHFEGSVALSALVKGLSDGSVDVSDIGFDITFEDFGMTFSDTGTGKYDYSLYGSAKAAFQMPVLGGNPSASFSAYVESASSSYQLGGSLQIGDSSFMAEADLGQGRKVLTASWTALGGNYLGIDQIVTDLGFPDPGIPPGLDLRLDSAAFTYDLVNTIFVLEADSLTYGKAVFVGRKAPQQPAQGGQGVGTQGGWQFFFGMAVNEKINLTDLPLIKSVAGPDETVLIDDIQVVIASGSFDAATASEIDQLIQSGYPRVPSAGVPAGVALSMIFSAGSFQSPLSLSTATAAQPSGTTGGGAPGGATTPPPATGSAGVPAATSSDGTVWYSLQKTFGPVSFQKVGIRYRDSILFVLMNASLSAGGLTISVLGLGVGSPLTTFEPRFNIDGLAISFAEGPIQISGGLLGTLDPLNFYGELTLGFPDVTISALGGYAEADGHPSFFLYAVLDYPIGGPSFFFVTGLAAGFGYNRSLLVPDVSGVSTFPLVQWAVGAGNPPATDPGGDIGSQVAQVLTRLSQSGVVAPSVGAYWAALGIRFTSFELLDSFALLTVSFGTSFEIDLLGLSRLTVPPAPTPAVASVELELRASFSPDQGLLAVEGQLTSKSYVFEPACHLTGGFAFYTWFGSDHHGEFVVTLGGYSPRFTPPSYYPQVPRLGLNWQVVPELTIKGDLYFALTSSAVMAGGGMSAVWKSGDITAWFDVEADFLMVFTPFHYYVSASIHLGASFRLNLLFTHVTTTIHIGVGIEVWGPQFTGKATVDLDIISFTIDFGASGKSTQTTIKWSDFVDQLMPKASSSPAPQSVPTTQTAMSAALAASDPAAPTSVVQLNISNGLLKTLSTQPGQLNYVVSGELFELTTQTAIPATAHSFSDNLLLVTDGQPEPNTNIAVGPVGTDSSSFTSTHAITIEATEKAQQFHAVPVLGNVPKALWELRGFDRHGVPVGVDPVNDTTVQNAIVGYKVTGYAPPPDRTPLPIPIENLQYDIDPNLQHFAWSGAFFPTADSFASQTVSATIAAPPAQANRLLLLAAIAGAGLPVSTDVDLDGLTQQSTNYLLAEPALSLLGEQKSSE